MFVIFTDGSSRGNPGSGGYGAIVASEGSVVELGGGEPNTTNNRMEIMASISALQAIPVGSEAVIYTDSSYLLNGATRWVFAWKKNKWKTSQKEDVLNRDLWEELLLAMEHKIIDWQLIRGHVGHSGNERCDVIATSFADNKPVVLYKGSRERYGVSLLVNQKNLPEVSPRGSKKSAKVYSYISLVDNKIETHKTWLECESRVKGISGAKYKKAMSAENEEEIIKEFTKK